MDFASKTKKVATTLTKWSRRKFKNANRQTKALMEVAIVCTNDLATEGNDELLKQTKEHIATL